MQKWLMILAVYGASFAQEAQVVAYPPIPSLTTGDVYTVTVNGQSIWTEKFRTQMDIASLPDWFTSEPYTHEQQELHIVAYAGEGRQSVLIQTPRTIDSASVRPQHAVINPHVDGSTLAFVFSGPQKLYIEIDDLPPLLFFADPLENDAPSPAAPNVRYFAPGVHRVGLMTLQSNETVYLAAGAVVFGGIRATGVENIRVLGRGILDGGFQERNMVRLVDCRNVHVEGVTIRNGVSWTNTLVNCEDVVYRDVKVVSFGPGGDGINPVNSRRVTIERCFLRCTDDCVAIKTPNYDQPSEEIRVIDNTMIGFAFSDGVTIGFETNAPIRNVTVRNCDILQARGGSMVSGHSAFSIICDGPSLIEDVRFENLRVAADVLKAFELHVTDGKAYGDDPPGNIRSVRLKNITWEAPRPIILKGFDETHRVQNVTFENCSIAGGPLVSAREDLFQVNEFVDHVEFFSEDRCNK